MAFDRGLERRKFSFGMVEMVLGLLSTTLSLLRLLIYFPSVIGLPSYQNKIIRRRLRPDYMFYSLTMVVILGWSNIESKLLSLKF